MLRVVFTHTSIWIVGLYGNGRSLGSRAIGVRLDATASGAISSEGHFSGTLADNTHGALFFFQGWLPKWSDKNIASGVWEKKEIEGYESARDCRRLLLLRGRSHVEEDKAIAA
jgi:hypothetical protein